MSELSADQRRSIADRERATRTLPARVASIEAASGDLVTLLERVGETVADKARFAANREAVTENLELALSYARRIREAIA
jgi:hypothetical protein